jgi:MFS family permease
MSAMMVHLFLHMEQGVGLSRGTAALMWTIASAVNIPSRLVAGVLGDRLPKHMLYAGCVALMGCSILVLGLANSVWMTILFAVFYGAAWGARTPLLNSLHADYWGLTSLGKIVGTLGSMAVPLSIAGPVIAGLMADAYGSYRVIFVSLSIASFFGAGLIFLARPPKPPATEPDVTTAVESN